MGSFRNVFWAANVLLRLSMVSVRFKGLNGSVGLCSGNLPADRHFVGFRRSFDPPSPRRGVEVFQSKGHLAYDLSSFYQV